MARQIDDPELIAMSDIAGIIGELPDEAKPRVCTWLMDRLGMLSVEIVREPGRVEANGHAGGK